jgi:hypothetical protein
MKVSASNAYMEKEAIRQVLYDFLVERIAVKKISTQDELTDFWKTLDMASRALRAIPYDTFTKVLSIREVRHLVREILNEVLDS